MISFTMCRQEGLAWCCRLATCLFLLVLGFAISLPSTTHSAQISLPSLLLQIFLGTLVSALLWVLAREVATRRDAGWPMFARADVWVAGASGGFCGCLSTASTFANELDELARASG